MISARSENKRIMSETKRPSSDQDPDYDNILSNDQKRLKTIEKDNKEVTVRKIESIIKTQFNRERQLKEIEVDTIDQRLYEARKMLDQLRACIVISYYSSDIQESGPSGKKANQLTVAHPAVRKLLERMGKASFPSTQKKPAVTSERVGTLMPAKDTNSVEEKESSVSGVDSMAPLFHVEPCEDGSRGARFKLKKRIVVGNVSKYIPVDKREEMDQSTHKWMVYVRGPKEEPRIDHFVKKVWFFLHPSYRPNDLVEVSQHPFHLTRRGWGEFPVRVQLQFHDPRNKRVDILHTLKLDKSYTGLQTLGAETLVDVLVYKQEKPVVSSFAVVPRSTATTTTHSLLENNDEGGVVIPANNTDQTSGGCQQDPSNFLLTIKQEPLDVVSEVTSDELTDVQTKVKSFNSTSEKCTVSSPLSLLTLKSNSFLPSTSATTPSNLAAVGSVGGSASCSSAAKSAAIVEVPEATKSPVADSRPANGLSTFVKCVDKQSNLYLIPLSMFLKLNPETQASVIQSVVSATTPNASDTVVTKISSLTSTVVSNKSSLIQLKTEHPSSSSLDSSTSTSNSTSTLTASTVSKNSILLPLGLGKKSVSLLSGLKKPDMMSNSTVKLVSLPKFAKQQLPAEISTSPVKQTSTSLSNKDHTKNNQISKLSLDSFETMDLILKHILKYYPLIDSTNDKALHPYCCSSMKTFLSWNIGKRHASEWQRAKAIRTKLVQLCSQCTKWNEIQIWSVKKILLFCRHHGYTPMRTSADNEVGFAATNLIGSDDILTYTEASTLLDKLNATIECPNELVDTDDDEDKEVDVLKIDEIPKAKFVSSSAKPTKLSSLRLPSTPSGEFVRDTIEQIGARVGLEVAVPGVMAPLAEEVLFAATQSFMEDIIRASHAVAFERNESARCPPSELTVADVGKAVTRLPNCDFLTDRFMGTKMQHHHSLNYANVKL